MREIKFRAWHIASGAMLEWDRLKHLRYAIENETFLVLQYTSLKDKNGKEIYEGDIVKVETYYRLGEFSQKIVRWEDNGGYNIFNTTEPLMEIIGNIYENPELIK